VILVKRPRWFDGSLWWRTYREGGFDGWRTIGRRRMPCDTMRAVRESPHMHDEIRQLIRH
jgi:hypothetical protein